MKKSTKQKKKAKKELKNSVKNSASNPSVSMRDREFLDWLGVDAENTPKKALSQATYFTCLKVLSEAMGKLPLKLYRKTKDGVIKQSITDTLRLLSLQPNPYMTATVFWTLCEMLCQHYGNAFVWIDGAFNAAGKYGGKYEIRGFYPMHPDNVSIMVDDVNNDGKGLFGTTGRLYYQYTNPNSGEQVIFRDYQVLHFKTWCTEDGIMAKSVREILRDTIAGASAALDCENNLYKNGMTAKMAMQYSGQLDDERVREVQKKFADKLSGSQAVGKIIAVPAAFNLIPLNSSFTDNQFIDLRKFSALQIAAAFGIKPGHLNSYEFSKYASSEYEALAFLTDTLAYRIKMYEDEINAKLLLPDEYKRGFYYKFNEKALLRTDSKTQSEILKNYTTGCVYTTNDARDVLDMSHVEGGDVPLVNGSYVPLTQAGAAYASKNGGKTNEDNKN